MAMVKQSDHLWLRICLIMQCRSTYQTLKLNFWVAKSFDSLLNVFRHIVYCFLLMELLYCLYSYRPWQEVQHSQVLGGFRHEYELYIYMYVVGTERIIRNNL